MVVLFVIAVNIKLTFVLYTFEVNSICAPISPMALTVTVSLLLIFGSVRTKVLFPTITVMLVLLELPALSVAIKFSMLF